MRAIDTRCHDRPKARVFQFLRTVQTLPLYGAEMFLTMLAFGLALDTPELLEPRLNPPPMIFRELGDFRAQCANRVGGSSILVRSRHGFDAGLQL